MIMRTLHSLALSFATPGGPTPTLLALDSNLARNPGCNLGPYLTICVYPGGFTSANISRLGFDGEG
jgi:hypothetical protein